MSNSSAKYYREKTMKGYQKGIMKGIKILLKKKQNCDHERHKNLPGNQQN